MLQTFFKLFILLTILSTSIYATTYQQIEDELIGIKIELEQIKIIQKYESRDRDIKKIEESIKELEIRLNKTLEKDIKEQDKRIRG